MRKVLQRFALVLVSRRSVGLGLMLLLVLLRVWDPAPLEEVRLRSFDLYQHIEPRSSQVHPVVIVDIDEESIAAVEVLPQGRGLHWEALDVDISLPGLVNGIFGTRAYMARFAGQSTSPAKAAAARANGAKGGRPRKAAG